MPYKNLHIKGLFRIAFLLFVTESSLAETPAFPGAEGFGASAKGGRGGDVIYVTNLNDSGSGSLRAALESSGPRTIIFRVGGTINLETSLVIINPSITIAGQTAPGDGITLRLGELERGAALFVEAADVIIRHIRIRVGPASIGECCRDAITFFDGADRAIIDHVSLSWGTDETLNIWGTAKNISIQRSIISESLLLSSHAENGQIEEHSMGALFGDRADGISLHHNLFAHNNQRNPLINSNIGAKYEHVNNVFYNYGDFASVFNGMGSDPLRINHIGNLYLPGTNSRLNRWEVGVQPGSSTLVFVEDNIGPHRTNNNEDQFAIVGSDINFVEQAPRSFQQITPFSMSAFPITTQAIESIFDNVVGDVGATLPRQDSIDRRIIQEVSDRSGNIINDPSEVGGWINAIGGDPYTDSDQDGMSNEWEIQNGLNPNNANDRNGDEDNDGYTNLEEFLNLTNPRSNGTNSPPPETTDEEDLWVIPMGGGRVIVAPL